MTASEPTVTAERAPDSAAGEDRIVTVPNAISLVRLACLPWFWYLLFGAEDRLGAAVLLAVLGATDWVDGYIARRFDQVSSLGKVLDPVADRLLFFVGITGILIDGSVPAWFAAMVLVREAVVATTTVVLAAMGARRVDVTWYGKAGTFCLMFAFPLFLASASDVSWAAEAEVAAWVTGIPGLVLSYVSWALYLPLGLAALEAGRRDRAEAEAADAARHGEGA